MCPYFGHEVLLENQLYLGQCIHLLEVAWGSPSPNVYYYHN
jgi:hypothetical protein